MKYLLDTETISSLYDRQSPDHLRIRNKLETRLQDTLCVSVLTLYELEYGYSNAPQEQKHRLRNVIERVNRRFVKLPLREDGATLFGELKLYVKTQKSLNKRTVKQHTVDVMLASTAILEACVIVSKDRIYRELVKSNAAFKTESWAD